MICVRNNYYVIMYDGRNVNVIMQHIYMTISIKQSEKQNDQNSHELQ